MSAHALAVAEKAVVVHIACSPLVLTLLADDADANVGILLDAVPRLSAAVEPMRAAVEAMPR